MDVWSLVKDQMNGVKKRTSLLGEKLTSRIGILKPKKTNLKDWHGGVESRAGRMIGAFTVCC